MLNDFKLENYLISIIYSHIIWICIIFVLGEYSLYTQNDIIRNAECNHVIIKYYEFSME